MSVNVKISEEAMQAAREQAKLYHRTIGGQVDYWVSIGRLAENHPGLTFDHLQKLMRMGKLSQLSSQAEIKKHFQAVSLDTQGFQFDRDDANAR